MMDMKKLAHDAADERTERERGTFLRLPYNRLDRERLASVKLVANDDMRAATDRLTDALNVSETGRCAIVPLELWNEARTALLRAAEVSRKNEAPREQVERNDFKQTAQRFFVRMETAEARVAELEVFAARWKRAAKDNRRAFKRAAPQFWAPRREKGRGV